jgi:hypothetical protein
MAFLGKAVVVPYRYRGRYRHKVWIKAGQGSFGHHDLGRPVSNYPARSAVLLVMWFQRLGKVVNGRP